MPDISLDAITAEHKALKDAIDDREDDLRRWCTEALVDGPSVKFSADVAEAGGSLRDCELLWQGVAALVARFERDLGCATGFADAIATTVRLVQSLEQLESYLGGRVVFRRLRSSAMVTFARHWSHLVSECYLDAPLRRRLPWREVDVCLAWALVGGWAHRRADDQRHELVTMVLEQHRTVLRRNRHFDAEKVTLERALHECDSILGDPTAANSQLIDALTRFRYILDNPTTRPAVERKKQSGGPDVYSEMDMMKDIQSLRKILQYLGVAKSARRDETDAGGGDEDDGFSVGFLLVERVLQVTGEGLKNTPGSQNLSENWWRVLNNAAVPLDVLADLRNALSHYNGLSAQRKLSVERSIDVTLILHDLDKLERVFRRALRRIQLKMAQRCVANDRRRVDDDSDEARRLDALANCQTMRQMREWLARDGSSAASMQQLRFLLRQFDTDCDHSTEDGLDPTADMHDSFHAAAWIRPEQPISIIGDEDSSSTITRMSDTTQLQRLLEEVSPRGTVPHRPKVQQNLAPMYFDEFIDALIAAHLPQQLYSSISSELFLGKDFPLARVTVEQCLASYGDDELPTPDDRARTASMLLVLDAALYIRENWKRTGDHNVSGGDEFLDLVAAARHTPVNLDKVVDVSKSVGLDDVDAQQVLFDVLLDTYEGVAAVDADVSRLVTKVIRETCSGASVKLVEGSKESAVVKSARVNLIAFINRKVSKQAVHLTEDEFLAFKDTIHRRLNETGNSKRLTSTFAGGSARTWQPDLKLLKESASPYEKLIINLQKSKSLEESCGFFDEYLKRLQMAAADRRSAVDHFRALEQTSLESFLSSRIDQLGKLFVSHDITDDGTQSSMDRAFAKYERNRPLRAAVEMILLECLEILKDLHRVPADLCYEPGPPLSNISLRNYLAHGDALLDLCDANVDRTILQNAMAMVARGEAIVALRKLCEEPKILQFLQEVQKAGTYHVVHAANLSSLSNSDGVQKTLAKLQSVSGWEATVEDFLSVKAVATSERWRGVGVDLSTRIASEEAQMALLEGRDHQLALLVRSHPRICSHRFHGGWTMLHYVAVRRQNAVTLIDFLIAAGANVNAPDDHGVRPLHLAVLVSGDTGNLEAFLRVSYIDPNARTVDGLAALDVAVHLGRVDAVRHLLKSGADPNGQPSNFWSPLHRAANGGHHSIAQQLLNAGAAPNVIGQNKWSPLHLAIWRDHADVTRLLLNHGADPHARLSNTRLTAAGSAVHLAAGFASLDTLQTLLDCGVGVQTVAWGRHGHDRTPLLWATIHNRPDVVEFLVDSAKVDVNHRDLLSHTALHYALMMNALPTAKFLLERGAQIPPNILVAQARDGDVETLKLLEEYGAACDVEYMSLTPAMVAASSGQLDVLKHLMTRTVTKPDDLMHAACRSGSRNVVQFLVQGGHYPDASKPFGDGRQTPLHVAAENNRLNVVRYLVEECHVDMNATDDDGHTPCVLSLSRQSTSVVAKYLLENGASGRHAMCSAARGGNWTIVKWLLDQGASFDDDAAGDQDKSVAEYAACAGQLDTLNRIIEKGYDPKLLYKPDLLRRLSRSVLHFLHCKGLDLSSFGAVGVHLAAADGNVDACDFYLDDLKIDVNTVDAKGWTALHHAANASEATMVKHLLSHNADVNRRAVSGDTALMLASNRHVPSWSTIYTLVEAVDVSKEFPDHHGDTLVHLFLRVPENNIHHIQYCLERTGSLLFKRNHAGNTVLHEAALRQRFSPPLRHILVWAKRLLTESAFVDFIDAGDLHHNSALMLYISEGRYDRPYIVLDAIKAFCEYGADFNVQNDFRKTALHLAVNGTSMEVLDELLKPLGVFLNASKDVCVAQRCVANPMLQDVNDRTPLQLAQFLERKEFCLYLSNYEFQYQVQFLKDKQALAKLEEQKVDYYRHLVQNTLVHNDVFWSDLKRVETVVRSNPEMLSTPSADGRLPIHFAASCGETVVILLLIAAGSDVNATDNKGNMPLHVASTKGHRPAVEVLLEFEARHGAFNAAGLKPAHCAIVAKRLDALRCFFEKGLLDVHDQNEVGESLLQMAVAADFGAGIEYLLSMHDDCETPLGNCMILNEAVWLGNETAVDVLLDHGALSQIVANGQCPKSPLYFAIRNEEWSIAKRLIEVASNPQLIFMIANWGPLLLNNAASGGQLEVVQCLLERAGVNVHSTLDDGHTALLGAVYSKSVPLVEYLLKCGANPNSFLLKTEETALHIAAKIGSAEIVKLLLEHHTRIDLNYDVKYPLEIATAKGNWDVALVLLKSAGSDQQSLLDRLPPAEREALTAYVKNLSDMSSEQ